MVITRTPFRMSFFGGGTDYEPFFREHGGSVLSATFDKYCYVTVRHQPRFFDYSSQITYGKIERVNSVDEIEHPAVRNAMKMLNMDKLRVVYDADLPARSGLGSSSSFAVGMLNGFHALNGKSISKEQLAKEAIQLERFLCKEDGGWQDQIAAAYGGMNRIEFNHDGFNVKPVIITNSRKRLLNDHIMLFFTGFSRVSSYIAKEQVRVTKEKITELKEICSLVNEGENCLTSECSIQEFGRLLDYSWQLKRNLTSKISTEEIDHMYKKAIDAGAIGGKIMGAGGGGFLMIFAEPDKQSMVRKALSELLYVPMEFENHGTGILFYSPDVSSS